MEDTTVLWRSARDWAADAGLMLGAACYAGLALLLLLDDPNTTRDALVGEVVLAAVGCGAVWLRRRWPVGLAVGLLPLAVYGFAVDGAMLVALFTVALHRRARTALVLGAVSVVATIGWNLALAWGDPQAGWVVAFAVVGPAGVVGWGLAVRHRRQLVVSLRERATRAEAEATLRAEQAQYEAREQLATELHDVLGHRLSLLSVHAGALEYRKQVSTEEAAEAAGVIRAMAHQALQDLREAVAVLEGRGATEWTQPTFGGIEELVAESRSAGTTVDLAVEVRDEVPERVGRTAYRIVQEGLTNARKHAPAADVTVTVAGGRDDGLTVEVRNAAGAAGDTPGAGRGLVGLTERVTLVGGRLQHGPVDGAGYVLSAWLPWPA